MAERIALAARPRAVLGKGVRHLRREGILPANVYGKGVESRALQLDAREVQRVLKSHGSRSLFDLSIEGESASRPVLIRALSRKGGMGDVHHIDFYQVDPRRPITTTVALHFTGEAPAVKDLAGTLVITAETVHVRCLPLAIPDGIEADISKLVGFDVSLTVGDLAAPEGVEILTDPAVTLATVMAPRLRTAEEEAAEAPAAVEGEEEAGTDEGGEAATEEA
jgi:large subunit ribosomal protein L25